MWLRQRLGIIPTEEQITHLVDVLVPYIEDKARTLHVDYNWPTRSFRRPVPVKNFSSEGLSKADAVRKLKRALADRGRSDPTSWPELTNWFVRDWGGILKISPTTVQTYLSADDIDLAYGPLKGIASWSKVLTIRDPDQFAIFDARVSAALNALQAFEQGRLLLFPNLPTQNKRSDIAGFQRRLRMQRQSERISSLEVYRTYMRVMHGVAERLGHDSPDTAEMVLFTHVGAFIKQSRI